MKYVKKILFSILCVADLYFIYATIGYFVLGNRTPRILGDKETVFMGMYIMSITFLLLTIVASTLIIIFTIKYFRRKKKIN